MKKWNLAENDDIRYGDEYYSKKTIVKILNDLELQVKSYKEIIKGYDNKISCMRENESEMMEIIDELQQELDLQEEQEPPDYWRGKEDAYLKIIDDNIDRINALEMEKWYYEMIIKEGDEE